MNKSSGAHFVDTGLVASSQTNTGVLAISTVLNGAWIDLWATDQHISTVVFQKTGVASAGEYMQIEQSPDNGVTSYGIAPSFQAGAIAYNNTSNINMAVHAFPTMRYIRCVYMNGSTGQTVLKTSMGLFKGI